MNAAVIYQTLAEVNLLHEFYLTNNDGHNIFKEPDQESRQKFLQRKFKDDSPSITNDLAFELSPSVRSLMEGHKIRLLRTYSGFRLVVAVREAIQQDGSKWYQPVISFGAEFAIPVLVRRRSNDVDAFTNLRMKKNLPAVLFFSNDNVTGNKVFPFLSNPVSSYSSLQSYEQGELASYGNNDIRQYYADAAGDQWEKIKGATYASENDRILVPPRFNYTFTETEPVYNVNFTLRDKDNNAVKELQQKSQQPLRQAALDFITIASTADWRNPLVYTLEARINQSFTRTSRIIFTVDPEMMNSWAVILIKPIIVNDRDYSLFDTEGFLKTRKNAVGEIKRMPVLEIPIKSRTTYWRYTNEKKLKLKLLPEIQHLFVNLDGILVSKSPRVSSYEALLFQGQLSSSPPILLPCPVNSQMKIEQGRIYSDIVVGKSRLLEPEEP